MAIPQLVEVKGQWIDLYAATGIAVGTKIIVQNFQSKSPVALSDTAAEPTSTDGRVRVDPTQFFTNDAGDAGAWAYCSSIAKISVQEA